jgi:hypothetical protein
MTTFYSLRFEPSIFIASYDSQGYGGRIRPRLMNRFSLHGSLYSLLVTMENVYWPVVVTEACLPNRWLTMDFLSVSTLPAFRRHVTIL